MDLSNNTEEMLVQSRMTTLMKSLVSSTFGTLSAEDSIGQLLLKEPSQKPESELVHQACNQVDQYISIYFTICSATTSSASFVDCERIQSPEQTSSKVLLKRSRFNKAHSCSHSSNHCSVSFYNCCHLSHYQSQPGALYSIFFLVLFVCLFVFAICRKCICMD